jgi:hypothetical protein
LVWQFRREFSRLALSKAPQPCSKHFSFFIVARSTVGVMLRIQSISHALWRYPHRLAPAGADRPWVAHFNGLRAIAPRDFAVHPRATPAACDCPPARFEACEDQDALTDLDYLWLSGDRPPLENLSSALTIQNALLQRNVLLQTGMNSEHVGILVFFQRYSAKGASLPAVLGAVLASPEYAQHAEHQRQLMGLPAEGGGINLIA